MHFACFVFRVRRLYLADLSGLAAFAQELPTPVNQPYKGNLSVTVDLTDQARHLLHVKESIPVSAGHTILYYPKCIPRDHGPSGPFAVRR